LKQRAETHEQQTDEGRGEGLAEGQNVRQTAIRPRVSIEKERINSRERHLSVCHRFVELAIWVEHREVERDLKSLQMFDSEENLSFWRKI
jgi:hypothetical protein